MSALPNLIIAGPPKTGTTSIYTWLEGHPECVSAVQKETHYFADRVNKFNTKANFLTHGIDGYKALFPSEKMPVVFEASPIYIGSTVARAQLPKLASKPKLFFVYRDPVQRMWSEYVFFRHKLHTVESSFGEYLGWNGTEFSSRFFSLGRNVSMINEWTELLGEDRIFTFDFEELKADPRALMQQMCQILSIDASYFDEYSFQKENESYVIKNPMLHQFARSVKSLVPNSLKGKFGNLYLKVNKGALPEKSEEEQFLIEQLGIAYADQTKSKLLKPIITSRSLSST